MAKARLKPSIFNEIDVRSKNKDELLQTKIIFGEQISKLSNSNCVVKSKHGGILIYGGDSYEEVSNIDEDVDDREISIQEAIRSRIKTVEDAKHLILALQRSIELGLFS